MTTIPAGTIGEAPTGAGVVEESAEPVTAQAVLRHLVDFLAVIFLAAVVFKAFVAEGYYVPSGSMAPNLLGFHRHVHCEHCGYAFEIGADDHNGPPVSIACPMCRGTVAVDSGPMDSGDRLLVLKWFHEIQPPTRWETVVFRNPSDAGQAYIKRVVGLPGEKVTIDAGDVFLDGKIARKTLDQLMAMRMAVYDHERSSRCQECRPRFEAESTPSHWKCEGSKLVVDAVGSRAPHTLSYVHLGPNGRAQAVDDDNPYNGRASDSDSQAVTDLIIQLRAMHNGGNGYFGIRYQASTSAPFEVRVNPATGSVELLHDGRSWKRGQVAEWSEGSADLVFAYWDRRVGVRINGQAPFEDIDLAYAAVEPAAMSSRPVVLIADGSRWTIDRFRIDRDVHYRGESSEESSRRLSGHEYFMLGDNSPISNDSRKWSIPAVPASLLVGKPLWVHLPTYRWRGTILGRSVEVSLLDLSRIRAVR